MRAVPKCAIMSRPELFEIVRTAFDFLEAKDIGTFGIEKFQEVFLQDRAQAINIP